jgi:hypothetical protein
MVHFSRLPLIGRATTSLAPAGISPPSFFQDPAAYTVMDEQTVNLLTANYGIFAAFSNFSS